MKLSKLVVTTTPAGAEACWQVDGTIMRVLYRDTTTIPYAADMALISCLPPAMQLHQDISLDDSFTISMRLLENLEQFQTIFCEWFPQLRKVNITAAKASQATHNSMEAQSTASFFSGGVDASYTFFLEQQQIDILLFCYGHDIQPGETERFANALQEGQKFADAFGKKLCVIETNFRTIFPTDSHYYSQVVVFIGYAIGLGLKRLLVPASKPLVQMEPYGTHPLTDPLISNGHTEVIHHGMAPRTAKTKLVADYPQALDVLRVCNASSLYNCGKCEKCLRTMATLAVYDKTSKSLPALTDMKQLRAVKVWDEAGCKRWQSIAQEARANHKVELAKAAERICASYRRRDLAKLILAEVRQSFFKE